jgi:prepilin-type N-terminal cleavage/methylation domain-containing protein
MNTIDRAKGYSLLEFVVVVVLIGLVAAKGLKYYGQAIDDSRRVGIEALARNFTAAAAGIHAQWLIAGKKSGGRTIDMDNVLIYINKNGWPAGTKKTDKASANPALNCYQLWQALLQNPTPATVEGIEKRGRRPYHISSMENGRCRYELVAASGVTHYFDYALESGQVFINVPSLE